MAILTKEQVSKIVADAIDKLALAVKSGFDHVDERFGEVNKATTRLESGFNSLQTSVDAYATKADIIFKELLAAKHRMDRHEKWLEQIAKKIGVKLEY